MPINSHLLGPGTLTLGAGPLDISAQLTACKVNPKENVTTTEPLKVLSGEQLDGDETVAFDYTLEGSLLQDLAAAGVVAWSWTNAGTEQPFTFIPNTAADRQVTGIIKSVVPIAIGGDEVDARMTSDFVWRLKGTPDFDAVP